MGTCGESAMGANGDVGGVGVAEEPIEEGRRNCTSSPQSHSIHSDLSSLSSHFSLLSNSSAAAFENPPHQNQDRWDLR